MSFKKSANYVYVKHTVCVNSKMVVGKTIQANRELAAMTAFLVRFRFWIFLCRLRLKRRVSSDHAGVRRISC